VFAVVVVASGVVERSALRFWSSCLLVRCELRSLFVLVVSQSLWRTCIVNKENESGGSFSSRSSFN
jgi:hypothetical protein